VFFPEHHVRFIAVSESIDTVKGEDDFHGAAQSVQQMIRPRYESKGQERISPASLER